MPLIAEDLGVITPDVEALRDGFQLPGMKVLQFAFDGDPANAYLPHNFASGSWVAYTGTHDNATAIGWWQELSDERAARWKRCLAIPLKHPVGSCCVWRWPPLRIWRWCPAGLDEPGR